MKLENRILGMQTFKEINGITYKLCTKCQQYYPMTDEYFPRRSNVKCGFGSHCKKCEKEKENNRVRVPAFNNEGLLYCKRCKQYKPVTDFYENGSDIKCRKYYSNNCKQCESERKKKARDIQCEQVNLEKFLKSLINGCKTRALKSKKYKCTLTVEQLVDLWNKQKGLCAISGLQMTTIKGKGKMIMNASIDRIQPGGDYSIENVQLVCSHVNMMRSDLSIEELVEFCKAIVNNYEQL